MSIRQFKQPPAKEIEKFINEGAGVKSQETDEWTHISLRIPKSLLKKLDELKKKRIGLTRNALILESVQDKVCSLKNDN